LNLNESFKKGMAPQEYVSTMTKHQDNLVYVYKTFDLPDDQEFFQHLKNQDLSVLVITEDWCGDAMLNIPILLRICEEAHIQVRMISRDEHPELMDQYLTNGSKSIPIFIFINSQGEQQSVWGPRAPKIQGIVDEAKDSLPSKDKEDFEEKQREMILFLTKAYRENDALWSEVYESIKQTLYK